MVDTSKFFVGGHWCDAAGSDRLPVIDPSTEEPYAEIAMGNEADVDAAVAAARQAFPAWARSSKAERKALLERICAEYERRMEEIALAISKEMGAPISISRAHQAPSGLEQMRSIVIALDRFNFSEVFDGTTVLREPIGVCALITPWNWPLTVACCKIAMALAAGCTIVLKPSEESPISSLILAEVLDAAGTPPGVFNLVNGSGPVVGSALSRHPDVDLVSFTGSTAAGIAVAKDAADTVKRVSQELGGKSPNVILEDADLHEAVSSGTLSVMLNSGQTCTAPTRMLVPRHLLGSVIEIARTTAESLAVGRATDETIMVGPVVNARQFQRIQRGIERAIDEGAALVTGGPGRPDGLPRGYFVRPTIFAPVTNDMTIAREEIFGPVLAIVPFESDEEAIAIANDTPYGLSSQVWSGDPERAFRVARQIHAGEVYINGQSCSPQAPFGGYKQSGNGREQGVHGIAEFTELKSIAAVMPASGQG